MIYGFFIGVIVTCVSFLIIIIVMGLLASYHFDKEYEATQGGLVKLKE